MIPLCIAVIMASFHNLGTVFFVILKWNVYSKTSSNSVVAALIIIDVKLSRSAACDRLHWRVHVFPLPACYPHQVGHAPHCIHGWEVIRLSVHSSGCWWGNVLAHRAGYPACFKLCCAAHSNPDQLDSLAFLSTAIISPVFPSGQWYFFQCLPHPFALQCQNI